MHPFIRFLRTTFVGGILFLVPIVVIAIVLGKALALARGVLDPFLAWLPLGSVLGIPTSSLLAIGGLVLGCFLAGLAARTALAQKTVSGFEATVLSNVPGYTFLKGMGESLLGVERKDAYPVVLARFDDAWQLGFRVEEVPGGLVAVYVPGSPNPQSGSVYLMAADRVIAAAVPSAAALQCLQRVGAGAGALLRGTQIATGTAT